MLFLLLSLVIAVLAEPGYLRYSDLKGKPYTVGYNNRSLLINGEQTLFLSGSLHYPRFAEGAWNDLFIKSKSEGLNLIQLYVFWNYHETHEGVFNWEGNANLVGFIELAASHGFFVNMRIGPYLFY